MTASGWFVLATLITAVFTVSAWFLIVLLVLTLFVVATEVAE